MKTITRLMRLTQISVILLRHGLDEWLFSLRVFHPLRFLSYANPYRLGNKKCAQGERIRLALEELGPIFVKFGQALSTRRDLIPEAIADELAKLQDRVPPFPGEQAKLIIEKAFKQPLDAIFSHFNLTPLASASVAQVHTAQLLTGDPVVVKVIRPHINKRIQQDIDLLYALAELVTRYWPGSHRFKPREVIAEFESCLKDELDLLREAASASQLRRNFLTSDLLYVPKIYWSYAETQVLVMERIHGIPISNIRVLKEKGINLKKLAERGVEIFFTQVFRDCFFHADMHPGNIFVSPEHKENPQYLGVDFGIMGSLDPKDQRYLAENLMAFFKRDYRRVAQLHVESGWIAADTRINEFEAAIRTVCEPIFERPLKEISFGQLLLRLFQTARRFNMEVQPQLVLLQKTLFNVEGLGRQLYPDLDLWSTAKPYLEQWLKKQLGPRAFLRKVRNYAPYWAEKLPEIPDLFFETLVQVQQNNRLSAQKQLSKKPTLTTKRQSLCSSFLLRLGLLCSVGAGFGFLAKYFSYLLTDKNLLLLGGAGLSLLLISLFSVRKSE